MLVPIKSHLSACFADRCLPKELAQWRQGAPSIFGAFEHASPSTTLSVYSTDSIAANEAYISLHRDFAEVTVTSTGPRPRDLLSTLSGAKHLDADGFDKATRLLSDFIHTTLREHQHPTDHRVFLARTSCTFPLRVYRMPDGRIDIGALMDRLASVEALARAQAAINYATLREAAIDAVNHYAMFNSQRAA